MQPKIHTVKQKYCFPFRRQDLLRFAVVSLLCAIMSHPKKHVLMHYVVDMAGIVADLCFLVDCVGHYGHEFSASVFQSRLCFYGTAISC